MTRSELVKSIFQCRSYLCVGLDTDISKLPGHLSASPESVLDFNKAIIDATKDYCTSYKLNSAFYEAMGAKGWEIMQETFAYIPSSHLKIADAKRGDIGNTSDQYAKAFFEVLGADAITVAPYMGEDSIRPFLEYEEKWTIVLGLTSNKGSNDFQRLVEEKEHKTFYRQVMEKVASWGNEDNLMFVTGATQADEFETIRSIIPNHFLLVPGVGAQGGSLEAVSKYGMTKECGLLVNASRAVIYASSDVDFAEAAGNVAKSYMQDMNKLLP